jgi:hypothetical protein
LKKGVEERTDFERELIGDEKNKYGNVSGNRRTEKKTRREEERSLWMRDQLGGG